MRLVLVPFILALSACSSGLMTELPTRAEPMLDTLPPMKSFRHEPRTISKTRANEDVARDFLELAFEMESGKQIEKLTKFEGPITVALAVDGPERFSSDLDDLLVRFRNEAGLSIRRAKNGVAANIVIATLPRKKLQATVPHAACFVVPRVGNWEEFRKKRRTGALDWTTLEKRERTTVFIPDDVSPQEVRDCLHEEIAQALGPLNDIYRLSDSVYNDDNINTILTNFDMLILRIFYAPEIRNGMSRSEVADLLPNILTRLNPDGDDVPADGLTKAPRQWVDAIEASLGSRKSQARRLTTARQALAIARSKKWEDNRLGFSLFTLGHLALGVDSEVSVDSFLQAYAVYAKLYGKDDIHTAHVALQLAAFSLSKGDADSALKFINDSLPSVARAQNAALLSTLLMIKAEALDFKGRRQEATTVHLDSLGWARYGFSSEKEIRLRLREIAALRPRESKSRV